jgi:tetratricopeptide (TPR) repeat protein
VLNKQDKNSEALEKYEEAYSISVEVNGPEHGETVMVLDGMSRTHANLGNKDRAIELMEKGIDIQRRTLGGDSLQLAESLESTAEAILMLHDASKALEIFEESVHISVRALGSVNHEKVADIVASIACCKGCLGDNAEATMFLREACRIYDHLGIQNYKSRSAAEQLLRVQMIQLMSLVS